MSDHEAVIGLEVHVELATATKMFCACPNEFGAPPNTNVCPVCLGLPGALPVTNRSAVELAIRFGAAVGSRIGRAIFHRKNYFYPDMPKDFQISQYDEPICVGGSVEVPDAGSGDFSTVRLVRAHLEEDTGKSVHVGGSGRIHDADHTLVDYNRSGVPLLEIVTEPDIRSAEQARGFVNELRAVLAMLGVSDVKMEEGSLRVDANVSVRPRGSATLGTKVEVKNMNSVRSVAHALEFEFARQCRLLDGGGRVEQETRHWDEVEARTHGMRSKEEAMDYRYFPEPDLVPIAPDPGWVAEIRDSVPAVMPARRAASIASVSGLGANLAAAVAYTPGLADWVDAEVAAGADSAQAYVWASQEVLAHLNETGLGWGAVAPAPGTFVELAALVDDATLSKKLAREVLGETLATGRSPREIVDERGLAQISDDDELAAVVADVVAANPDTVERYKAGNEKVAGFLVGQVMKATGGKANPGVVQGLVRSALES
ncbi:MAG: Asp-tRNA(Asn)/Glu-tRNA(Gln) amidotransferase subunit GatB [Acidimicrobiia bacterium]